VHFKVYFRGVTDPLVFKIKLKGGPHRLYSSSRDGITRDGFSMNLQDSGQEGNKTRAPRTTTAVVSRNLKVFWCVMRDVMHVTADA
jgi:hypothetical protein